MANEQIGSLQAKLQTSTIAFQKIEQGNFTELASVIEARQRLDSQLSENELVLKEFNQLKPHNTVYKLVGPSLLPQDPTEAKQNVEKRLDYIRNEITRVEAQLEEIQERAGKKKDEIIGLQQQFQALQGPGAGGPRPVAA